MLLTPVITVLLFEVIAALGRYQIRLLIITPFILVFISSEQFKPPLFQLHVGVFLPATIRSGFTGNDGMTDCLILFRWVLQQFDLRRHFLGNDRKTKLLNHPGFRPELSVLPP